MKTRIVIASGLLAAQLLSPLAIARDLAGSINAALSQRSAPPLLKTGGESPSIAANARGANGFVDCPQSLVGDAKRVKEQQQSLLILDVNGAPANISLLKVPGSDAQCALMVEPETKALSAGEFQELLGLSRRTPVTGTTDRTAILSGASQGAVAEPKSQACNPISGAARLYAGRCGTPSALIGSAYIVSPYLALSIGPSVPANVDMCVEAGNYYDVHTIRRNLGTGKGEIVGLMLDQSAGSGTGMQLVNGVPTGVWQIDGNDASGSVQCSAGVASATLTYGFDEIQGPSTFPPAAPPARLPGGPAFSFNLGTALGTVGVHADNQPYTVWDALGRAGTQVNPIVRRFVSTDVPTLNAWIATAQPPADKAIAITYPRQAQLVDSTVPINVTVTSPSQYTLTIDGQPTGNTLPPLADGSHWLVAYNSNAPQYRHTVSFSTRHLTIAPDAYEPDNTQQAYTPLFSTTPHSGNFHASTDIDWTAFAVGPNTTSTVTLAGTVAKNASLKLYRQLNYPNGSIDPIATVSNVKNQLVLSSTSGNDDTTVYYVEAKPTSSSGSGPGSEYTISVATTLIADSYEFDDTLQTFKALYAGAPQNHNFHKSFDSDWTAFAVGPSTRSTVTLTGTVAANTSLKMYRQINYPNGSIDLVTTSSNTPNQVVVSNDSGSDAQTVYYVEARPTSTTVFGNGTQYSIAVTTAPLPDAYEVDDTREAFQRLFAGSPQAHTFHNVTDQDWVAYAVGPNVTSRVDLQGAPAASARLELYRQDNYPDGPIVLVSNNQAQAGTLSVQDMTPPSVSLAVYYLRAAPIAGNTAAVGSYTLSVNTY